MATTILTIDQSDGWVEAAADTENFQASVITTGKLVFAQIADAAPAVDALGHPISEPVGFVRAGCDGKLYLRTASEEPVQIAVSTGAL